MEDLKCVFKNCDGQMVNVGCGCKTCKKCNRTDGSGCTYL